MTIFDKQFSLSDVSRICNASFPTIQNWAKTPHLMTGSSEISGGGKRGKNRSVTFLGLMEVAYAAALVRHGFLPRRAFSFAREIAFISATCQLDKSDHQTTNRQMGLPCHHNYGETLLAVVGDRSWIGLRDGSSDSSQALNRMMADLSRGQGSPSIEAFTILNISRVFLSSIGRIDIPELQGQKVLDEIYPEEATGQPESEPS